MMKANRWTALGAGAVGRSECTVTSVTFREDGATVETASGETIRCAFVIDASGQKSVVADELGLRETPPRMRTSSRAIFTHMEGVKPFEDVDREPPPLAPWSQGTLHHFFDGGWMWVIPFGNFAGSQNQLCSVGLSFDNRRFPRDPADNPEEIWSRTLDFFSSRAASCPGSSLGLSATTSPASGGSSAGRSRRGGPISKPPPSTPAPLSARGRSAPRGSRGS